MKSVWTKVGAVALAGVAILNACIPYAVAATDTEPVIAGTKDESAKVVEEFFSVADYTLDFGRVSELGRSYTKTITVRNNTTNDVIIDASVSAFEGDAADNNRKLSQWIAFVGGVTHFNVAAGGTREVNVRVALPEDAPAGSQYANITLTDANGHAEKVMVKMDVAGDGLKYNSEVSGAWIDPVHLDDSLNGRVAIKNTGTAGFTSTYQIKAKNVFGGMDWIIIKETSEEVFPGKQVEFSVSDKLGFGVYTVEQRVTFVNAEGRISESMLSRTVINIPWWLLVAVGGFIILLIIVITVLKRRHRAKNADKMARAERKVHKAEIARIEKAEEKAIAKEKKAASKKEKDEDEEIAEIAGQLDDAQSEEPVGDDDAIFDEEEATPIKIVVKKRPPTKKIQ